MAQRGAFRSKDGGMASPLDPSPLRARPQRLWMKPDPEEYERALQRLNMMRAAAFTTLPAETPAPAAGGEPDDTAPAGVRVEDGGFEADPEVEGALEQEMMGEDALVAAETILDPCP